MNLKDCVKGNVTFTKFKSDALWYVCENGFEFPVPVEDTKNGQGSSAEFLATDRAMMFMRWIRKHLEYIDKSKIA